MDTAVLLQKQIKDNNEDLQNYMRDLKLWETEMKRKDRDVSGATSKNDVVPPVRRKKKKVESAPNQKAEKSTKRIPGYDYSSWDKFDVDKACEDIDKEGSEESEEETSADDAIVKREQALYEKALGNRYVQDEKWDEAIDAYSRAITSDPNDTIFYANRALCYLKKKKWKEVETDCTTSIQLDKSYVKAYQRRVEARKQLGKLEEAHKDLLQIITLEPNNRLAKQDLAKVEGKLKCAKVKDNAVSSDGQNVSSSPKSRAKLPSPKNEAKHLIKAEKSEVLDDDEPLWSSDVCCIEPIDKPPHLRSKKPLKRIPVKEVNSIQSLKYIKTGINEIQPIIEKPLELKQNVSVPCTTTTKDDVNNSVAYDELPPPPKTSVQFEIYWKKIKTSKAQCYQFLKQIRGQDLPKIFKESLESNTFSDIISILASEFVRIGDPILEYLEGLSEVRRFGALTLFMSSDDKSNLNKLFHHCKVQGESSEENISRLRKLYQI